MDIQISNHQLYFLLEQAAEIGAKVVLAQTGRIKPFLKKSEAFQIYGRRNVEHWITDGLVTPRKDGDHSARWRLDRIELETAVKSTLMLQYL